ncbi:hypothetical protein V2S66_00620 [Streptomyces sp. V4-01]|uniref:DUF6895 domain-containing protein n=1 Tax=Actinacidiphila polyblastidii TaxID=3110430 RepID=A0ABU7P3T6_9ACTN|nr:hypothetical protein [Streptomyces sp. V4-01]
MSGDRPGAAAHRVWPAPAPSPAPSPAPADGEPAHPDAALLDDVVTGALRRLASMRPSFRLPPDVATEADPNTTLKPLGELAELAQVIHALHPVAPVREAAAELFGFAWKETRGGELFEEMVRGEPAATYPVELYGVFARAGLRHPGTDELIESTTALRRWRVAREDHTRTLNVLNAERRIGLRPHADFDAVLARTGLGHCPEPWSLDRRAAYGITHDVFHTADWGRTPDRLPAPLAEYLRLWLPAWTETWLEERLWDLAGEFLAVSACLPGAPYDPLAWRRLAAARSADGALPESGDPPPQDATEDERFTACYHSTLVAAFAATLARARPPAPLPRHPRQETEATP